MSVFILYHVIRKKNRRRKRKVKLAESKIKKEPVTPLPSQEIKEEKDTFQLPSTTETLLSSLQELYYGTLYIQKVQKVSLYINWMIKKNEYTYFFFCILSGHWVMA